MVDQCSKLHLVEWVTFFSNFSWTLFSLFCPNLWPLFLLYEDMHLKLSLKIIDRNRAINSRS